MEAQQGFKGAEEVRTHRVFNRVPHSFFHRYSEGILAYSARLRVPRLFEILILSLPSALDEEKEQKPYSTSWGYMISVATGSPISSSSSTFDTTVYSGTSAVEDCRRWRGIVRRICCPLRIDVGKVSKADTNLKQNKLERAESKFISGQARCWCWCQTLVLNRDSLLVFSL